MSNAGLIRGFQRPTRIVFQHDKVDKNYGRFIIEPFEKGYGITLGNALRRTLMNSIEGAAITALRIDGVSHEFATIEGVKEDVTRIILNLKKVKLKYEKEESRVFQREFKGPMVIKAKDLISDPDVTIQNPEHEIAHLNEEAEMNMNFQIDVNRGYLLADSAQSNESIGVIPVDAMFSPIEKVNFRVEDTRVGQRTDFDKLVLEIWTDGSLKPDDALAQAAKIIKDHMTIFINFEEDFETEQEEVDEDQEQMRQLMSKPIEELEFSVRTFHCVKSMDAFQLRDVVTKTEEEIRKARHYSERTLEEIKEKLGEYNLTLGMKE